MQKWAIETKPLESKRNNQTGQCSEVGGSELYGKGKGIWIRLEKTLNGKGELIAEAI